MPGIVTITNVVRGSEPRLPMDLLTPVREQLGLVRSLALPATFLLMYDALCKPEFTGLFDPAEFDVEVGAWLEICQELVEDAFLTWRGRDGWSWDYFSNVGQTVGYTPEERILLIDTYMERFLRTFGRYPTAVGAHVLDAVSYAYLEKTYDVQASCFKKEQWGTDGYNIWGGYYAQAFYPSRNNALCPGQDEADQVRIPVFRQQGSDPIYQYEAGLVREDGSLEASSWQPVYTIEPVFMTSPEDLQRVDWYFRNMFNGRTLSFGYIPLGQENSFGWPRMRTPYTYQLKKLVAERDSGSLRVLTLSDAGRWFQSAYPVTPGSALVFPEDWKNEGREAIWYSSRFYRIGFLRKDRHLWIRDLHRFDSSYHERYLESVETSPQLFYDNLPIVDGHLWSLGKVRAGMYFHAEGRDALCEEIECFSEGTSGLRIVARMSTASGVAFRLTILCEEERIGIEFEPGTPAPSLEILWSDDTTDEVAGYDDKHIYFSYNGFRYSLPLEEGVVSKESDYGRIVCIANQGRIRFRLRR